MICWSGDWPGTVCWSTASGARETARTRSSSSRRLPTIGRKRRSSATADVLVLSRFAYMRRRGNEMVLESPRAGALFRICNPKIAAAIAMLSTPQQIKRLRRQDGFPGVELLALLVDCQILFKIDAAGDSGLRPDRGRRQPRSLGLSRSSVPHAQHGRPARQPAGRSLSLCRRHASAAGGAAPLARKENRSAQVLGRAVAADLAGRKAAARTSFDPQLR